MTEKKASWTAVLVCQGRAVADGRLAVGRFADPVAVRLLRPDERAAVDRARAGEQPRGWRERMEYELLGGTAGVLAVRTVVIDDAVRAQGNSQLVLLGAGLDARAWRMSELAEVDVFEVDHPASQADKRDRVDGLTPVARSLTHVAVEFGRDALDSALRSAGFRDALPTTWIWEGVLPYLTDAQVAATLTVVADLSAPGSRLIATYPTRNRLAGLGRHALRLFTRLTGGGDPLRHEPHLSTWSPQEMRALLNDHGLTVTDDRELFGAATELGIPVPQSRAYGLGRAVIADKS
ncbi:class I SAM-dependent methyltransferase [Nocardia sp. NPDC003482]